VTGASGAQGNQGNQGFQGAQGNQGNQGNQGIIGTGGNQGNQGRQGPNRTFHFYADQLDNPVNSDWTINALAPAVADSNNAGIVVRRFDDTTEEGVGFILTIPSGSTNIIIGIKSRAETAPGGASQIRPHLYNRGIPDNAAVQSWSSAQDMALIDLPTNENFQYDEETISLATIGATAGELTQFELTRHGADASDDLTGDWTVVEITVSFS